MYGVLVTRPDGSQGWLSDTDNDVEIWTGSKCQAENAARCRQGIWGNWGYVYEVVKYSAEIKLAPERQS